MKSKRILRFYFGAERLERALDNLIFKNACGSATSARDGQFCAEKIMALIGAKEELGGLWVYLDGIMSGMDGGERAVLERYASMRRGIKSLPEGERREIRRCVIKFFRRARGLERFGEGLRLVNDYYCLL